MKRVIGIVVLLTVSAVLVCGADEQPSPCVNLLGRLYECVDHIAYYKAKNAQTDTDTMTDCCKQYDVYTENKCFWCDRSHGALQHRNTTSSPECQTGNDLLAHARTYSLDLLLGFCAGTQRSPLATHTPFPFQSWTMAPSWSQWHPRCPKLVTKLHSRPLKKLPQRCPGPRWSSAAQPRTSKPQSLSSATST